MAQGKKFKDMTDQEALTILAQEIKRLGIQDHPSRIKFMELRDKDKVPSPTYYMKRFNMPWKQIINMIGLDYSLSEINKNSERNLKGKRHKSKWNEISDQELLEIVIEEMNRLAIRTKNEYVEWRDKENTPSYDTLRKRFGSWKGMLIRMEKEM